MTNINCTADCIHQKEGKCCLDRVEPSFETKNGCAYFKGIPVSDRSCKDAQK